MQIANNFETIWEQNGETTWPKNIWRSCMKLSLKTEETSQLVFFVSLWIGLSITDMAVWNLTKHYRKVRFWFFYIWLLLDKLGNHWMNRVPLLKFWFLWVFKKFWDILCARVSKVFWLGSCAVLSCGMSQIYIHNYEKQK